MTKEPESIAGQAPSETAPALVSPDQGLETAPAKERGDAPIATPEEVLAILTNLLRGSKSAEQLRAAEHLAKHFGMLSPREETAPAKAAVAAEIEAAMRSLEEARHGQVGP